MGKETYILQCAYEWCNILIGKCRRIVSEKLVNIHVLLLILWSRLQLFVRRMDRKMFYKLVYV